MRPGGCSFRIKPVTLTSSWCSTGQMLLVVLLLLTITGACPAARSQALRVQPRRVAVQPNLVCVFCSITISPTPTAVSFSLVKSGTVVGSAPVVITTTLAGFALITNVSLYGYFSSASVALTDGASTPNNIPSSAVLGQMTTGSLPSFTAFTGSPALGPAGAGLTLFSTPTIGSTGCPTLTACRTDTLNLEIKLSALPQLPAGTYSGMLILQVEVM